LKNEASLWQQEAQLYGRKAAEALSEATGAAPQAAADDAVAAAAAQLRLDPALAAALLAAPLEALRRGVPADVANSAAAAAAELPGLDEPRFRRDLAALQAQELPYFRQARACGHCGSQEGPEALADRAWFDLQSYLQYKALGRQLGASLAASGSTALSGWERMHAGSPEMALHAAEAAWAATGQRPGADGAYGGTPEQQLAAAAAAFKARGLPGRAADGGGGQAAASPPLTPADVLRLSVGAVLLEHVEADLAAAAELATTAQGAGAADDLAAIRSTSPELDAVRGGAQALLRYFADRGEHALCV
jgi:hypothetical protein